jgi:hypothetical protein
LTVLPKNSPTKNLIFPETDLMFLENDLEIKRNRFKKNFLPEKINISELDHNL